VRRGLAHGERAGQGQMLEHGPRRVRQLAPGAVTTVKRQVDGAEELGEALGVRPFIGHVTRVPAGRSIVNPDGSAPGFITATPCYSRICAQQRLIRSRLLTEAELDHFQLS
jgi:hypothetical protein